MFTGYSSQFITITFEKPSLVDLMNALSTFQFLCEVENQPPSLYMRNNVIQQEVSHRRPFGRPNKSPFLEGFPRFPSLRLSQKPTSSTSQLAISSLQGSFHNAEAALRELTCQFQCGRVSTWCHLFPSLLYNIHELVIVVLFLFNKGRVLVF